MNIQLIDLMKMKKNGIEEIVFKQDIPYIMDLTFKEYNFKKQNETIKGYTISEINKIY